MEHVNSNPQRNSAKSIIFTVLLLSLVYAMVRYNIVGPVPWKDFPFYILNKALALAAFVLLALNFGLGPLRNLGVGVSEGWLNARKSMGMTGFLLVLIHALISFLLFNPEVYASFFGDDRKLTLVGNLSMLGGVLGFVALWAYNMSFQTFLRDETAFIEFITSRGFMLFGLTLGGFHLFFMGYKGWMTPGEWHGGIPPISLVGFTVFVVMYLINLFGRR